MRILKALSTAFACASLLLAGAARAEIKDQTFDYKLGDTVLEGFVAFDTAKKGKRPAVLIFPQWTGLSDHERIQARELAKLGYVAMVADIYGKGIRPPAPKASGAEMAKYLNDRPLLRARSKAGLDRLLQFPNVDPKKVAAIGYCFGGASALEIGRQGASVAAIASFHGVLSNPTPADAANIKAPVLVLHGADDPAVPPKEVDAFKAEMKDAKADLQFVAYSGTVHSFTIVAAGSDPSRGSAYNPVSAHRSWVALQDFLHETINH